MYSKDLQRSEIKHRLEIDKNVLPNGEFPYFEGYQVDVRRGNSTLY